MPFSGVNMLKRWAAKHGIQLLRIERRFFLRGPFFLRSSEYQAVYRIVVRLPNGRAARGWARCGGWWLGTWGSDAVKVKWDAESRKPSRQRSTEPHP